MSQREADGIVQIVVRETLARRPALAMLAPLAQDLSEAMRAGVAIN
ncbi:hypothetical protein K1Y38_00710 [Serratia marcescens]|nr:hypothetical protein [Serratia marcescens]